MRTKIMKTKGKIEEEKLQSFDYKLRYKCT